MDLTGIIIPYLSADYGAQVCWCESSLVLLDFIENAQRARRQEHELPTLMILAA